MIFIKKDGVLIEASKMSLKRNNVAKSVGEVVNKKQVPTRNFVKMSFGERLVLAFKDIVTGEINNLNFRRAVISKNNYAMEAQVIEIQGDWYYCFYYNANGHDISTNNFDTAATAITFSGQESLDIGLFEVMGAEDVLFLNYDEVEAAEVLSNNRTALTKTTLAMGKISPFSIVDLDRSTPINLPELTNVPYYITNVGGKFKPDYFISPNGDDTLGDGTLNNPFKTISDWSDNTSYYMLEGDYTMQDYGYFKAPYVTVHGLFNNNKDVDNRTGTIGWRLGGDKTARLIYDKNEVTGISRDKPIISEYTFGVNTSGGASLGIDSAILIDNITIKRKDVGGSNYSVSYVKKVNGVRFRNVSFDNLENSNFSLNYHNGSPEPGVLYDGCEFDGLADPESSSSYKSKHSGKLRTELVTLPNQSFFGGLRSFSSTRILSGNVDHFEISTQTLNPFNSESGFILVDLDTNDLPSKTERLYTAELEKTPGKTYYFEFESLGTDEYGIYVNTKRVSQNEVPSTGDSTLGNRTGLSLAISPDGNQVEVRHWRGGVETTSINGTYHNVTVNVGNDPLQIGFVRGECTQTNLFKLAFERNLWTEKSGVLVLDELKPSETENSGSILWGLPSFF